MILVHEDFLPILEAIKGRIDPACKLVLLTDDGAPADDARRSPASTRRCSPRAAPRSLSRLRREHPGHHLLHDRHHRRAQGRLLQPPPARAAHARGDRRARQRRARERFHREDVYMPLTPMFHVHAWGVPYVATMLGVKQVYPGRYVPDLLLKLIAARRSPSPTACRRSCRCCSAARARRRRPLRLEDDHRRLGAAEARSPRRRSRAASTSSPATACRRPARS